MGELMHLQERHTHGVGISVCNVALLISSRAPVGPAAALAHVCFNEPVNKSTS